MLSAAHQRRTLETKYYKQPTSKDPTGRATRRMPLKGKPALAEGKHMKLTQEQLRELVDYDPETGIFTWKKGRQGIAPGRLAGGLNNRGYWDVCIFGKPWRAHRLAWLYTYGYMPRLIDHKNHIKNDNRMANLREATHKENAQNRGSRSNNKAGLLGVAPAVGYKKPWRALIRIDGKNKHLGTFDTPELAHAAYLAAKAIHHPFAYT